MSYFRQLYRAEQLPVFQNRMFATPENARTCTKGDAVLVQDRQAGLIFSRTFDPELMQYDADYQNEQAVSCVFRAHLRHVLEHIQDPEGDDCVIDSAARRRTT